MYLFSESGSYLGKTATTDADGRADLLIPEGPCKLRIDYSGTRHWTDVIHVLPHEQTDLQLDLDQLASELTHDPNPVRFDGTPPEPEPLLLASIGSLSHLLANAATAYTPPEDEVIYYYLNDHLGTPQKVIDQDGNVVWAADYKPFGEVNESVDVFYNRFRFPGQYYDSETGLHYNYHRYYDPVTGRYLTPDPIGLDEGFNIYVYALNNPVNWIDPYGLVGIGAAYGGSITFFNRRYSLHLEVRFVRDSSKQWNDLSAYSSAIALSSTGNLGYNECENTDGLNVEWGADLLYTNANNVSELFGNSIIDEGFSAGAGPVGWDAEHATMLNYDNQPTGVWEESYGTSLPPFPFGANLGLERHRRVKGFTTPILQWNTN